MPNALRPATGDQTFFDAGVTTVSRNIRSQPDLQWEKFLAHYGREFASTSPVTRPSGGDRKWQVEVLTPLLRFVHNPVGWDSYQGQPLRWDAGLFALSVLNTVMRQRTPIPHVVPSAAGGVQLEWHEKDIDLELHITAPYEVELWYEDHRTGQRLATDLSNDLSALATPIAELTSR